MVYERELQPGIKLRKGKTGWRIVYPWKNDDGTLNWFNILTGGSWYKLGFSVLIFLLIAFSIWSYYHDVLMAIEICNNVYAKQIQVPF